MEDASSGSHVVSELRGSLRREPPPYRVRIPRYKSERVIGILQPSSLLGLWGLRTGGVSGGSLVCK
eukprot:5409346-Pyramimonas_sp.AAC.1